MSNCFNEKAFVNPTGPLEFTKFGCTIFRMPRLSLSLLGPPNIMLEDQVATFRTLKMQLLLVFLAVEAAHPHRREELTGLLWSEQPEETARANLRLSLHRLRKTLQEDDLALFFQTTRDTVQFNTLSDHWLDVMVFNELIAECQAHDHEQLESCEACSARLTQAVDLYRGDFLAGISLYDSETFEAWVLMQRETLRRQAFSALETLIAFHDQRADYPALCRAARRQLGLEPWHEAAHRGLMRGLALSGDRDSALAQYETCQRVLEEELGIEPEIQTRTLSERIRAGELSPEQLGAQAPTHNLPAQLTFFMGREGELIEIAGLLKQPDVRLLTLVGAGGMGKTRLALEAARAQLNEFKHGVFFVSLAPLSSASALAPAIASALGMELRGDPKVGVLQFLRDKHLLLILDNFEHLLTSPPLPIALSASQTKRGERVRGEVGAGLVVEILGAAPQVQILVTSRERLQVRGENLYRVEGMDYEIEDPAASSAVRLFVQSARHVDAGFKLSEGTLPDVLRLCQLVDGMPLGLELAAAWVGMLPLSQIVAEIEHSPDFLAHEWQDAPERQRSMKGVFDWSWQLLQEEERKVYRQLSVFRGGFTRQAAQMVTGASLSILTRLVQKSLLRYRRDRYEIHELLRQFAAAELEAFPDEHAEVERQHSKYYLNFVATRERRLGRNEPRQAATEIRTEVDNVRQAWLAPQAQIHDIDCSAYALWQFCEVSSLYSEGEEIFRLVAERLHTHVANVEDHKERARISQLLSKLIGIRAALLIFLSQYDQAISLAQEAIALGNTSRGLEGETLGHLACGQAHHRKSQFLEARPHFTQVIELAGGDPGERNELLLECQWAAYLRLGASSMMLGEYARAEAELTQGLQLCQRFHKPRGEMIMVASLGDIARDVGDFSAAGERYSHSLQIARSLNYRWGEAAAQLGLCDVAWCQGEYVLGASFAEQARAVFHEVGDRLKEAITLAILGHLHGNMGNFDEAQRWLDESLQLLQGIESLDSEGCAYFFLAILAHQRGGHEAALTYALRSEDFNRQAHVRLGQAEAYVMIGHTSAGLHRLPEAGSAYRQALELFEALANPMKGAEAQAGLARLALLQNDLAGSLAYVEEILKVLADHPRAGVDEPFNVYLTCYRALDANHDPRAESILMTASRLLDEYASQFTDETQLHAFLYNVPSHRELKQARARIHSRGK